MLYNDWYNSGAQLSASAVGSHPISKAEVKDTKLLKMSVRRISKLSNLVQSSLFRTEQRTLFDLTQSKEEGKRGKKAKAARWALFGSGSLALTGLVLDEKLERERSAPKMLELVKTEDEKSETEMRENKDLWFVGRRENKIRHFSPIEILFDYFSSYQVIDHHGKKGLVNY